MHKPSAPILLMVVCIGRIYVYITSNIQYYRHQFPCIRAVKCRGLLVLNHHKPTFCHKQFVQLYLPSRHYMNALGRTRDISYNLRMNHPRNSSFLPACSSKLSLLNFVSIPDPLTLSPSRTRSMCTSPHRCLVWGRLHNPKSRHCSL